MLSDIPRHWLARLVAGQMATKHSSLKESRYWIAFPARGAVVVWVYEAMVSSSIDLLD